MNGKAPKLSAVFAVAAVIIHAEPVSPYVVTLTFPAMALIAEST